MGTSTKHFFYVDGSGDVKTGMNKGGKNTFQKSMTG